ncbi:MAG: hypothetical protein Q8L06_02045 [Pseudohongiella sp.]|nr:hypothetical protein [Pseudohongiella sp.]
MTGCRFHQQGLSLLELTLSSGIASALLLLILHLFSYSNSIGLEHQRLSRQLENAASVRHLLSHSVRDALFVDMNESQSNDLPQSCLGIFLNQVCYPPFQSWQQGSIGPVVSPAVVPDSYLIWLKQSCCQGVIADLWFLAYRGGSNANPPSLFRRRQFSDGRFSASEEVVEGVSQLTPELTLALRDDMDESLVYMTGLSPEHIDNWWAVAAVQFHVSLGLTTSATANNKNYSFFVAARQWAL